MLIEWAKTDFEFGDERGKLTQIVHKGWNQVNYMTSEAGAIRGNHYHKNNAEFFYIISGKIKLTLQNLDKSIEEVYDIKAGDVFIINKNINHIFEYLEPTALISMYNQGVEEQEGKMDIYSI